jgi:hypothetical protein
MLQIIKSKTLNFIIKNNNILEWSLWKKLQKKPLFNFQLLTSIFFTIIFYLPFLNSNILDFNFLQGDNAIFDNAVLWLPQLLSSYIYNNDFIFKGIDFYTHGGASEYFLRPNLIIYNPIILILSYVVNFGNLFNVFIFTLSLIIFFSILSCYYSQKLCIKFFNLNKYLSLFVAVGFSFSLFVFNNAYLLPFFLIVLSMPLYLYLLLSCVKKFNLKYIIFGSFVIISIYTSGYIVLSVFAILLGLMFCYFFLYINNELKITNILKSLTPFLIATLVIAPLYISILKFNKIVIPFQHSLKTIAHDLAINPNLSLILFSNFFVNLGEKTSFSIGLIPILIILIFIFSYQEKEYSFDKKKNKIAIFGLVLFFIIFLSHMGIYSPFSYLMYKIPVFGKMHLYSRYLFPVSIFFFLSTAILLENIIDSKNIKTLKVIFTFLFLIFLLLTTLAYLELPLKNITNGFFIFELILAMFFIALFILLKNKNLITFCALITLFLSYLVTIYNYSYQDPPEEYKKKLFYELLKKDYYNKDKIVNYLKNNSSRDIKKIIDISPNFSGAYFDKSLPWLLRNEINISSYSGYETHLARDLDYEIKNLRYELFDNNFLFIPNIEWLKKTGTEFIIFEKGFEIKNENLLKLIDQKSIIELPQNTFLAKLNFVETENTVFNNGYIRIISKNKDFVLENFKTNNSSFISFETNSNSGIEVQYLFFPNKNLKPYLNGKKTYFNIKEELSTLNIPSGKNKIEIVYKNKTLDVFIILYFVYLITLIAFIFYKILASFRIFKRKDKNI